jgi:hypothetical protein
MANKYTMANILIVGDSWGEPNWRGPEYPGFTEAGHTTYQLRSLGHDVINLAVSGGSNLSTWINVRERGDLNQDRHWVIWFHTEITRDWPQDRHRWFYQAITDRTADRVYSEIKQIKHTHCPNAGLILVEGQSTVIEPWFSQNFTTDLFVKDWRSELLGRPMPPSQLTAQLSQDQNILKGCLDSVEQQHQLIDHAEVILKAMNASDLFPDRCHPGDLAHQQLSLRIHKFIEENSQ